ncbi:DeoR/GlpR family DNA-binding transcription regulator [Motilibacter deserti]|uniref:DeoR/GlpR transcriptional regulator n=1 Tax=Motilibacter deserti TaxID=2714956 RepID=A0ABX0GUB0_9ACTN|nr:DeoR/GlpR family DNA-binding transcription regulator [Motilibacter deserti]NHC13335.1 DeoR/GlpR transcriptional regulator [Motilibacter deserti]
MTEPDAGAAVGASADSDFREVETRDRAQRWSLLLDLLAQRQRLSVAEVAEEIGVSEATVRRDFSALARQQLVTRTHGGVVAAAVAYGLPARYRARSDSDAKDRIAAVAADLARPGTVVGFNGGTTTTATARQLGSRTDLAEGPARPAVTVVTNALNIAMEMVLRPHVKTVVLGGVARSQAYELSGPLAALVLEELWLDVLILGVDGISVEGGARCRHEGEAGISGLMARRAERVVVAATSDKLGSRSFARICGISTVHTLVTDSGADPAKVQALDAAGVEVLRV